MKKSLIGAIVGGIILFIWQALSNTVLNLHYDSHRYTPAQDSILHYLNAQLKEDGRYFMPTLPRGASMDDYEKLARTSEGKPWAIIDYHTLLKTDMPMQMLRTLLTDIIIVWLLCWILLKIPNRNVINIFFASLFTGLIVFLNSFYTQYIWYRSAGLNTYLIDALASWGLCGIWLGIWLRKT